MNKRPERDLVEKAYLENRRRKAHEIAEEVGLIEAMGYEKAVDYVRSVKKSMREKGQLKPARIAPDEERLAEEAEHTDYAGLSSAEQKYLGLDEKTSSACSGNIRSRIRPGGAWGSLRKRSTTITLIRPSAT